MVVESYKKEDYTNDEGKFTYYQGKQECGINLCKFREIDKRLDRIEKLISKLKIKGGK